MEIWNQILLIPGMGGGFVVSVIALWLFFLASLMAWIVRAFPDSM